jgi:hypothetical protein
MNGTRHSKADDEFAVIGVTNQDTINGLDFRLTHLPIDAAMEMSSTVPTLRKLGKILGRPVAETRWVEVYFAASFLTERSEDPQLDKFPTVYYANKTALGVCRRFGLQLPKVIKVVKRSDLPRDLGKVVEFPWVIRRVT